MFQFLKLKGVGVLVASCLAQGVTFAQPMTFVCQFDHGRGTTFDNGRVENVAGNAIGRLVFDQLDPQTHTGRMVGNHGATSVFVSNGYQSLNIVEETPAGNLNITTIFLGGKDATRQAPAVHSRHINLGAEPYPSQSAGFCKLFN